MNGDNCFVDSLRRPYDDERRTIQAEAGTAKQPPLQKIPKHVPGRRKETSPSIFATGSDVPFHVLLA